jgi:hypothetical protein
VDLAVSGLPAGATAAFSPDPTTGNSSVLTVTTAANTPPGLSNLTISATATGVSISPITVSLTVTAAVGLPTITGFAPTSGPVGTRVSIAGTNLSGATVVQFNGVAATFAVNSPTSLTATVPGGASSGPIGVTTRQGAALSSSPFLVTPPKSKEIKEKELKEKESDGKDLRKDLKDNREGKDITESPLQSAGVGRSSPETDSGQLRHFIQPEWRPDLNAGTLEGESDLSRNPTDPGQPLPVMPDRS